MTRILVLALGTALLAGCQTVPAGPDPAAGSEIAGERGPGAGQDAGETDGDLGETMCAAEAYQVLVGQPAADILRDTLPQPTRIYARGDMVTMDYRSERLNIVTDDGVVIEVKCG